MKRKDVRETGRRKRAFKRNVNGYQEESADSNIYPGLCS